MKKIWSGLLPAVEELSATRGSGFSSPVFSFPGVTVAQPVKNLSQQTSLLIPGKTRIYFLWSEGGMSAVWFCVLYLKYLGWIY